ncbi:hypothetical protein SERLADRAFT_457080 [Serpula lacrymans var. lacrymans S7.9]|uniref:Glyoxalase/fosfomycin resistance/dioxygenase domain-containing protein n=1 Tax=Serpula lacrymans var. lacrymans (strain S7.9) TaxID=578457 RepID=F8NGR5_SERL9|nr:uncharacterized protein SERLADRAFT_457080 [Serpula lacrymans var. lacrymans S7.9]EGO29398.1 hypothetical protein SERLADRAFT_457080 [Serpula lacrymans var. lacrymans S7.9]
MAQLLSSAWKIIPKFQSLSISATIDFYVKTLGFIIGGLHPSDDVSEATFCSIFIGKKAEANIYFSKCESDQFHPREAMIALGTKQLDEFYEELKGKDVEIVEPIEDQEWGYRHFWKGEILEMRQI